MTAYQTIAQAMELIGTDRLMREMNEMQRFAGSREKFISVNLTSPNQHQ